MPNAAYCHWDDLPAEGDEKVRRKLIMGQGASLKRVEIKAGTTANKHSHPHEQFVLVEKGAGRVACETGEIAIRPGTVIHFGPDAWHSAVFDTDTVLIEVNLVD